MTMYFRSLFPSACPIGHNGWIEIGCPICRLYFFRDWTNIYDYVYPISIPKCLSGRIQYIRIKIGCPICKVDFFRDWIDFMTMFVYLYCQELIQLDPMWHMEIRYPICIVYSFTGECQHKALISFHM